MQPSRSSNALLHSCWEVAESRLEFAVSKAACCGLRQRLSSITVYIHSHIYAVQSWQYMLTFEAPQRLGRGMQRSRSSNAPWHSCWEVAESRLEFAALKAECCVLRQMLTSFTVYLHSHIYVVQSWQQCSHFSHRRDQAEACSATDTRLLPGTAVWKVEKAD